MKWIPAFLAAVVGLTACAAPPAPPAGPPNTAPIASDTVTVLALGLSCPNCALNVVLQLERFPGIEIGELDMGRGALPLRFTAQPHPSEYDIADAVRRAGYTFVGLEQP